MRAGVLAEADVVPVPRRSALVVARHLLDAERRALPKLRRQHDGRKFLRQRLREIDDADLAARYGAGEGKKVDRRHVQPAISRSSALGLTARRCADVLGDVADERIFDALLERADHGVGERRRRHLRRRHGLEPFGLERAEEHVQNLHAAGPQLRAHALRRGQTRGLGRRMAAVGRPVHQRMNGKQIDEGRRRVHAVGAARAQHRTERLGEPQQPEIADIHLLACDRQAVTVHHAAGADMLRRVDDDVDARAVLLGLLGDGFGIGHVERHDLDPLDLAKRVEAGKRLPGIGETDKHDRGARVRERLRHRLADGVAAIGDQHAAEFRIAGHLAQMGIVGHVFGVLRRQCDRDRRAALVELEFEPHPAALDRVAVQMRDHDRTGIELHGADPPRRALAKVRIGRGLHRGFRHQRTAAIDVTERQPRRQARRAGIARRVDRRRRSRGRPAGRSALPPPRR